MDLNRATTFVRVVETGGFARAAETLGLPPSSVSRSVAKLEDDLGVTLLERTTRKVALTDAGRAYFERARDALAGLEEANALALDAAREVHGLVRIAVPVDLGAKLGGTIAAFCAMHPRIRVEIIFASNGAELVGDVADLAVALGRLPDSSLVARKLGNNANQIFGTPAYLAARGTPRRLADLARHDGIVQRAVGGEARWELVGPKGAEHADIPARIVADQLQVVLDAAVAGAGLALLPTFLAAPHVATGALQLVLPKYSLETPLHVVAHAARHVPRRVALLRDHLVQSLSTSCKQHGALE